MRNRVRRCTRRDESDSALVVVIPDDTLALLSSPALGEPILEMGDIISETELNPFGQSIGLLPQRPWEFRPDLPVGLGAAGRFVDENHFLANEGDNERLCLGQRFLNILLRRLSSWIQFLCMYARVSNHQQQNCQRQILECLMRFHILE